MKINNTPQTEVEALEVNTASPNPNARRVLSKVLGLFARKIPLISGRMRAKLIKLQGVKFKDVNTVFIGEDVYFDDIYPEKIFIGSNVLITSGTKILSHFLDTKFTPLPGRPFRFYFGDVIIGDYVFIGMNVVIAKNITIGNNVIIGAGSVITKDIPDNVVVCGSPAKIVKTLPPRIS